MRLSNRVVGAISMIAVLAVMLIGAVLTPVGAAKPAPAGELVLEDFSLWPDVETGDCHGRVAVSAIGDGRYVTHRLDADQVTIASEEMFRFGKGEAEWAELFWTIEGGAGTTIDFEYTAHLYAGSRGTVALDTMSENRPGTECVPPEATPYLDGYAGGVGRTWFVTVNAGRYGDPNSTTFSMAGDFFDESGALLASRTDEGSCELLDCPDPYVDEWICDIRLDGISRKIDMVTFVVTDPDPVPYGAATSVDIYRN